MTWKTILDGVKGTFAWLDNFLTGLLVPSDDKTTTAWSVLSTIFGRAITLGIIGFIVLAIVAWIQGPVVSMRLSDKTARVAGVVYALPLTVAHVSGTATILSCHLIPKDAKTGKDNQIALSVVYTLQTVATTVADSAYTYLIPQDRLSHPFLPDTTAIGLSSAGLLVSLGHTSPSYTTQAQTLANSILGAFGTGVTINNSTDPSFDFEAKQKELCAGLTVDSAAPAGIVVADTPASEDSTPVGVQGRFDAEVRLGTPVKLQPVFSKLAGLSEDALAVFSQTSNTLMAQIDRADGTAAPVAAADAAASIDGIVYRYPAAGSISVCLKACSDESRLIKRPMALMLPGQEASLHIDRGWFGTRSLNLDFGAGGNLTGFSSGGDAAGPAPTTETDQPPD